MKAGDTMQYKRVSLEDALAMRKRVDEFISQVGDVCSGSGDFDDVRALDYSVLPSSVTSNKHSPAILHRIEPKGNQPLTLYRQVSLVRHQRCLCALHSSLHSYTHDAHLVSKGADDYLLIEYGEGTFDLNHRCRVTALTKALRDSTDSVSFANGLINTVGCCTCKASYSIYV